MKPVFIAMQAFGPYLKRQEISFEQLNRSQIFLISGPTGGGKTSILDAMSVALYGEATGGQRSFVEMRTNTAPEDRDTEVSFLFSLGKEQYRFDRRIHPYRKRNGILELRMEATCGRLEGDNWVPLESSSPKAVSKKAEELLGLTHQQFSQMMILPQGEFRKLLLASSAEKEKILEKLFRTQRWLQISRAVAFLASQQEKELEKFLTERDALLRQQEVGSLEELRQKRQEQAALTESAQREALTAGQAFQSAEQKWNWARQASDIQKKWKDAKEALESYNQRQKEMAKLADQLKQAKLIREVMPLYQSHCRILKGFHQREQELLQAKEQFRSAKNQAARLPDHRAALDAAIREKEDSSQELSLLRPLLEQVKQLEVLRQKNTLLTEKAARQEENTECVRQKNSLLMEQMRQAEDAEKDLQTKMESLPELRAALQRCKERREEFNSLDAASKSAAEAKAQEREAFETDKRVQTRATVFFQQLEQMEAALQKHTAAHLALDLQEGKPCPVCGAVHHPHPAQSGEEMFSQERLQVLREETEQEKKQAEYSSRNLIQAKAMAESAEMLFQTVQKRCARFEVSREENQAELSRLAAQVEHIVSLERKRHEVRSRTEQLKQACQASAELLQESEQKRRQIELEAATISGQIKAMETKLPQEKASVLCTKERSLMENIRLLENHIQQQQERIRRIETGRVQTEERFQAAQRAYEIAEKESQHALELWEKEASARNLKLEVFPKSQESRQPVEQWEEQLHQFHTALQYWEKQEEHLRKEAAAQPAPDLLQAERQYQIARAAKTKADERLGEERARMVQMDTLYSRLADLEAGTAALEKKAGRLQKLDRLVSGKNSRKTPLHQFVLGLMLDDILQSSNLYLNQLSSGRYQMDRRDGEIGGGGYKGLELEICDGYQGGNRPVGTLSGGEMFLASLSLAFGLSDVVQRGAGGIRLDSIFIDEGFGTLDRETREAVMQSLAQIRASGRVVGLISHVEELRDVIPARIEVQKNDAGESVLRVSCPKVDD